MFDIIIRNGLLVDGTGAAAVTGDLGIQDGRITVVGNLRDAPAETSIDAVGLVVAPGFIDIHTHSDLTLLVDPRGLSKIMQGVTTDLIGHCGTSPFPVSAQWGDLQRSQSNLGEHIDWNWTDLAGYRHTLHERGVGMNVAPLVGHGSVRSSVVGFEDRPASADEVRAMQRLVAEAMDQGAFGLSTGLSLPPSAYGDTGELIALCQAMAVYGNRIHACHMRGWSGLHLQAIAEVVEISRRSSVPGQLAHMAVNDPRHWGEAEESIVICEQAVDAGIDVSFDVYPYAASSSGFSQCMPTWSQSGGRQALVQRLRDPDKRAGIRAAMETEGLFRGWPWLWDRLMVCAVDDERAKPCEGMTLQQAAEHLGMEPLDAALTLMDWDDGKMHIIFFYRTEEDMRTFLRHPFSMVGSDGLALMAGGVLGTGKPHPRSYGAAARVLGRYVRQEKVLTLEDAVHKMSGKVANRLGLTDRGRLAAGMMADVVVFDPETVIDRAAFERPHQYATGIRWVLVNGRMVVRDGAHTDVLAGRVLEAN